MFLKIAKVLVNIYQLLNSWMFMYEYICNWNNLYIKNVVARGHLCMNVSHQAKLC